MGRKKGKIQKAKPKQENPDSNQVIIDAKDSKPEVSKLIQKPFEMSSKKRKRLDKYIEKKLKKEKRVLLFQELSKTSFTSDLLHSSKNIKVSETKKQKLSRNLHENQVGLPLSYPTLNILKEKDLEEEVVESSDESEDEPNITDEPILYNEPIATDEIYHKPSQPVVPIHKEASCVEEEKSSKPAFFVQVNRRPEIEEIRSKLPVYSEEQEIMDKINNNLVTVICGETGSGKTTQIPQFLFEAGYGNILSENPGKIGITQPRKVAAINMAKRVSQELNLDSSIVSYQVRYDSMVTTKTVIKFMTDGILLKETSHDFLLKDYSVLIIDEAHERNLNTDILIGLLSRIVLLRDKMHKEFILDSSKPNIKPLRLIIMSATLRIEDFTLNRKLFANPPPTIEIQTRQFKVTNHFALVTKSDYVSEAFSKICQIHSTLPPGGILVFLTGQDEILRICRKLKEKFPSKDFNNLIKHSIPSQIKRKLIVGGEIDDDADLIEDIEIEYANGEIKDDFEFEETKVPLHVLPLFSSLNPKEQQKVFESVPENCRLCVVATNVAETSLTIPNIKYVVDCGKVKNRNYDLKTGIEKFEIEWISKASADQRSGRSGRTEDGHCYRLYSSSVYENEFPKFSYPEIVKKPLESVVLLMKSMGIDNVVNFPFPTQPNTKGLLEAEKLLISMDAFDSAGQVTKLGRLMARFPIHPRFSKMLFMSCQMDCLPYIIAIVSGLTVGDIFLRSDLEGNLKFQKAHQFFVDNDPKSDMLKLLSAIGAYQASKNPSEFCVEYSLNEKMMKEIILLQNQLISILNQLDSSLNIQSNMKMTPPNEEQKRLIRQVILCGFIDRVAKLEESEANSTPVYSTMFSNSLAKIHPSSSISNVRPPPKFVIYGQIMETTQTNVTIINREWLSSLGKYYCETSKALKQPPPFFDSKLCKWMCWHTITFGPKNWELSNVALELTKKSIK